jgi:K+-transporting ATPase ATPase B chain
MTTALCIPAFIHRGEAPALFTLAIALGLWFTLLFANFAEAMAEGRGKAQANSLRSSRRDVEAKKLSSKSRDAKFTMVPAMQLRVGDIVLVEAGEFIPSDGEAIEGIASVNESAITGESAPVIRESGGDRSAVTGGTQVISDWLIIKVTANPGETFLDHMIELIEGTKRKKTPNELALSIMLAALTLVFLLVCATLLPFSIFSHSVAGGEVVTVTVLIALFVCLAPTTIGALL